MKPDQAEYAIKLARAGRLPKAASILREVVRREPRNIVAWKWLAYATTDPREALTAIQTVIQLRPGDQWAREAWPIYQQYAQNSGLTVISRGARSPSYRSSESWLSMILLVMVLLSGVLLIILTGGKLEAVPAMVRGTVSAPLGQSTQALPPEVKLNSRVQYYSFEAGDVSGIQNALYTQGPTAAEEGEHSIALTNYELWVTWQMAQSVTGCRIDDVVVHLDLTYTYPQWVAMSAPDPALQAEWNRFYRHVVAHEEHHGQIARECAVELADLLESYDPGAVCTDAQSDLDQMVRDLYSHCEGRQQAFDADQGRTTFPLPPDQ